MDYALFYNSLLLFGGILVLVRSGTWLVYSLIQLARFLQVSEYVLSFLLMSVATTLPELFVGISSALGGTPLLSLGNVQGSIIVNLSLILGIVVIGAKIFKVGDVSSRDAWFTSALIASPVVLMWDGNLNRVEAVLLLLLFLIYANRLIQWHRIIPQDDSTHLGRDGEWSFASFLKNFLKFFAGILLLLGSSYAITLGAKNLIQSVGLSETFLGFFVIAIGTSLPELTFALRASLFKHEQLSLGNLIGASVLNATLVLGVTGVIVPITVDHDIEFRIGAIMTLVVVLFANVFLRSKGTLTRREGAALIALYGLFVVLELIF